MAAAKKTDAIVNASDKNFDFSAFMPEGWKADDLRAIGGLTPIYAPEAALEEKFPPVAGWLDRIELLPEVTQGKDKATGQVRTYVPIMIRVQTTAPTKGIMGKGDALQIVDVAAGDDILVPVTGNLRANKVLLGAVPGARPRRELPPAVAPDKVYFAILRVTGQQTVENGDMWVWDTRLHPKTIERSGRYALPEGPLGELPQTASGHHYDPKTGEIKEHATNAAPAS
jgi:hypothetical protein